MSRSTAVVAIVLGSVLATPASAQTWSDFSSAFQLFPCHDGWSGCRVQNEIVQPDMAADSKGMPTPAHLRVGWFDLQATQAFSPFVELSTYTGELAWTATEAVADAGMDPEPLPEPEDVVVDAADIEAELDDAGRAAVKASASADQAQERAKEEAAQARAAAESARREQEEARARQEAAKREADERARKQKDLEAQQAAAASQAEKDRLRKEAEEAGRQAAAAEAARKKAEEEQKRKAEEQRKREEEAKKKAEEEERKRQEADARRKAEEEARKKAEDEARRKAEEEAARKRAEEEARKKAEEEARKKAEAAAGNDGSAAAMEVAPPPAAVDGSCTLDELVRLEPQAMLGKLSDGTIAACEQTLSGAPKMTDKGKISRILMVNAFSKGDKATWEKLVKRHLDEIDQSDPDLCYKYALHLSKKGPSRASGVIRWSDVALENRTRWTGDTYTSRVFSLYKLRAAASQSLWMSAEKAHAESPSDETGSKVEKYRSMTKVMAREWYEYAKVSGKDTTKALQLCMSAAGTKDYCEAG